MDSSKFIFIILFNLIYFFTFSQGEFIVEIDRTNGNYVKTGPVISGVTWVVENIRTYNENNGIFIFPSASPTQSLFSIDVSNDSIISNPPYNNITEFEYSNSSGILYGLLKDNINDIKYFASINPTTGIPTPIGNAIPSSSTFQGMSTFDHLNNRYIFIAPGNLLYTIDATNGYVISNPVLNSIGIICISYDNSTNILYGLLQDNSVQKYFLVSIDMTTGTCTKIGTGTILGSGCASSAIDEANQQFLYLYYDGIYKIATIDISTGNVLYNNIIQYSSGDLFYSLEYDNLRGKLYAMHWDANIDSIVTLDILPDAATLGNAQPNPNNGSTQIPYYVPENIGEAKIIFVDMLGNVMEEKLFQTGYGLLIIDTQQLPVGTYSYSMVIDGKVIDSKQMLRKR